MYLSAAFLVTLGYLAWQTHRNNRFKKGLYMGSRQSTQNILDDVLALYKQLNDRRWTTVEYRDLSAQIRVLSHTYRAVGETEGGIEQGRLPMKMRPAEAD
jgi:hypothetical protein